MAQNNQWLKTIGTQVGAFILGLTGVRLKNSSGELHVKTNDDSAFSNVALKELHVSSNAVLTKFVGNAAATAHTMTLPAGNALGTLANDGSGNLSWAAGGAGNELAIDSTPLAFGSTATVSMFTTPASAYIDRVEVIVDTAFDGSAPTMSVGVNGGSSSKYMAAGDVDLKTVGRYTVFNTEPVVGGEDLEIAYVASSSAAGAARVLVVYGVPV